MVVQKADQLAAAMVDSKVVEQVATMAAHSVDLLADDSVLSLVATTVGWRVARSVVELACVRVDRLVAMWVDLWDVCLAAAKVGRLVDMTVGL